MNKKIKKKLRSLIDCRNHWSWLWITGSDDKQSYLPADDWPGACACCRYDEELGKGDCGHCPLNNYAWAPGACLSCPSLYASWEECGADVTINSYAASRIVWACNKAIEDILLGEE